MRISRPQIKFDSSKGKPVYHLSPKVPRAITKAAHSHALLVKKQMAEITNFSDRAVQNIQDIVAASSDAGVAVKALSGELKTLKVARRLLNDEAVELTEKTASHLFVQAAQRVGSREASLNSADAGIDTDFNELAQDLDAEITRMEQSLDTATGARKKQVNASVDAVLGCLAKCQDVDDAIEAIGDRDHYLIFIDIPADTTFSKATKHLGLAGEVTPGSDRDAWNANVVVLRARQAVKDRKAIALKKAEVKNG